MIVIGGLLFAKSDGHHFHQATFDFALEIGMGFYAIDNDYVIRLSGISIQKDRHTVSGGTDVDHFHGRFDGGTHRVFRNSIMLDDFFLAFPGCTAVTAHCRHDKGRGADFL